MTRYLICCSVALCLQLSSMHAQDSHRQAHPLDNIRWKDFTEAPLDSLLAVLPQAYQPYEITEDPVVKDFIHFTILLPAPAHQVLQVRLLLQPRYHHYKKLRPWDSASTAEWSIRSLDTALIDKLNKQDVRNTYCLQLLYYHYRDPEPHPTIRRSPMPYFPSWNNLEPSLQQQFRQAFEQLTGQKP